MSWACLAQPPVPWRRIVEHGTLELQAYDEALFPGLAQEWGGKRPFIGSITMELSTETDDDVAQWIASGTPPIYFGFGSTPIERPDELLAMIEAVCAELGERALICSGIWSNRIGQDSVKVVKLVNYPAVFPSCRAVVHHGGAGTTAAGLRAGVPTVILWSVADQPVWANRVERLKVGVAQRFSRISQDSLLAALQTVLAPDYETSARALATRMTKSFRGRRAGPRIYSRRPPSMPAVTSPAQIESTDMWTTVLVLAIAVNFEPTRIGLVPLMLVRPRPLLQLFAFLCGCLAMTLSIGLLVLFVSTEVPWHGQDSTAQ